MIDFALEIVIEAFSFLLRDRQVTVQLYSVVLRLLIVGYLNVVEVLDAVILSEEGLQVRLLEVFRLNLYLAYLRYLLLFP